MHAAPSVTYPVARSAFAGAVAAALVALGALAAAAWTWQASQAGWRQALAWAAVAVCGAVAAAAWWRSPAGVLRWDGTAWTWQADGAAAGGSPRLALDLQSKILLRWQPDAGRVRWLWLERTADSTQWEALRRAVYSRASTPVPPAGEPPPA
jgi:hypothetical protein